VRIAKSKLKKIIKEEFNILKKQILQEEYKHFPLERHPEDVQPAIEFWEDPGTYPLAAPQLSPREYGQLRHEGGEQGLRYELPYARHMAGGLQDMAQAALWNSNAYNDLATLAETNPNALALLDAVDEIYKKEKFDVDVGWPHQSQWTEPLSYAVDPWPVHTVGAPAGDSPETLDYLLRGGLGKEEFGPGTILGTIGSEYIKETIKEECIKLLNEASIGTVAPAEPLTDLEKYKKDLRAHLFKLLHSFGADPPKFKYFEGLIEKITNYDNPDAVISVPLPGGGTIHYKPGEHFLDSYEDYKKNNPDAIKKVEQWKQKQKQLQPGLEPYEKVVDVRALARALDPDKAAEAALAAEDDPTECSTLNPETCTREELLDLQTEYTKSIAPHMHPFYSHMGTSVVEDTKSLGSFTNEESQRIKNLYK